MPNRIPSIMRVVVAIAIVVGMTGGRAEAEPIKCQREIAKRSAKLVQLRAKLLQKCEDRVLQGKSGGPCPDGKTAVKLAKAESKLGAQIAKRCGGDDRTCGTGDDDALATIGWDGGSCPNLEQGACDDPIAHCGDVASCLACIDTAAVDQVIGLYYDALAPSPTSSVRECQRRVGKEGAKFVRKASKALLKCEDDLLKEKIAGPCPDERASSQIIRAQGKLVERICKSCGGADKICGIGGDDLDPATVGFPTTCPDVMVPGGAACGGPIGTMTELVECVRCVSAFKATCVDAVAVPGLKSYPAECGGAMPTPTVTMTPPPNATTTPTPAPTPTVTATPNDCGDGFQDPGEDCDGSDDAACPGQCRSDCTCPPPCILPNPLPEVLAVKSRPGGLSDSGWTGIAHDQPIADDAIVVAVRLENCDLDTQSPTCGQCDAVGPVRFPGPAGNCFCYDLADPDASTLAFCDPEATGECTGPETCECFNNPPLPLVAGGIPVCTLQRFKTALTGTANIADQGAHAGEIEFNYRLDAIAHNGLTMEQPCPACENDPTPLDGQLEGTCAGGPRDGDPCDEAGFSPFFGGLSPHCPPSAGTTIGNLAIILEPQTTGVGVLGTDVPCTASGFTSQDCFCDTCATIDAEPCRSDADCPASITCGGRRCLGGANVGVPCAVPSDCPGSFCSRPGQPTAPNQCNNSICSPDGSDPTPHEGVCASGPFDGNCDREPYRPCNTNGDCNPPPQGSCDGCLSGQICRFTPRECPLDPVIREGVPGVDAAVLIGAYCLKPTSAAVVNQVPGIPGPGTFVGPVSFFRAGSQCGNGAIDSGEDCDPPLDGACPGTCQVNCQCPICGDGLVNQPSEECDGADDGACPGVCQPNCTCNVGACGNDVVDFGEECDGTADGACPGACQGDCTCGPFCGDGAVDPGEECDGPSSTLCPAFACQGDCTCGSYCGDDVIDPGEDCDGTATGACPGSCEGDCTCAPVCGDNVRQAGELCDGTDDAACPGQCNPNCTCPGSGEIDLFIESGADLDAGWSGTVHDAELQRGSRIWGDLSNCDGQTDFACDYFGNIGSFCTGDPSRSCTEDAQCSGGVGPCVLQYLGPPLPVSAGGVPACAIVRFSSDAVGTYDLQSGDMSFGVGLNALAILGGSVSQPCPICDCGKPDPQDCEIGETGTCSDRPVATCTVQGTGRFGPTSLDCQPPAAGNVTGSGLALFASPITTGLRSFASSQPCDGSGFQHLGCWCDGQTQPNGCLQACDGGSNDAGSCNSDADCPGGGACVPLCRQTAGEPVGEGECIAGPIEETCQNAPEIGCSALTPCPPGTGPCVGRNQRCFMDPLERQGTPSTTSNVLGAAFCVPATGSSAIDQAAGLPGPTALLFATAVTAGVCGDGVNNRAAEECDGGDDLNCPGQCLADCTCDQTCGNNILEFGEQCDGIVDTACPGQCAPSGGADECTCPPVCGDGFVGAAEECDPGGAGGVPPPADAACPGLCNPASCTCPPPVCGDGVINAGEVCELPATGCGPLQACLLCTQCIP